jgi:predicted NUDIX family NTP pyrophosphohydrolase
MPKSSAGILMYRVAATAFEVLLVHPGGPFYRNKDDGAWSIPKGEHDAHENPLDVARREFEEETGYPVSGAFLALEPVKQKGGKVVSAWAVEGDCDAARIRSNTFEMEWPPRSGKRVTFPEVDRAGWFLPDEARAKLLPAQRAFVDQLCAMLGQL